MVIKELKYKNEKWEYCPLGSDKYEIIDINNVPKKLWIIQSLNVYAFNNSNVASSIISKIAVGGIRELRFYRQEITFNEFKFLTNALLLVVLNETSVVKENGEIAPFEMLLQNLPPLKIFMYYISDAESLMFTPESTKRIIKALINSKFTMFALYRIPETFDFDAFSKFMKKTPRLYDLQFRDDISYEFRQKLQTFQNILSTNSVDSFHYTLRFPRQTFPDAADDNKYLIKCVLCFLIVQVFLLINFY